MVARMLGAAPVLADAIVEQLCRNSDRAADAHKPIGAASEQEAEYLAANVWRAIWPVERSVSTSDLLSNDINIMCFPVVSE